MKGEINFTNENKLVYKKGEMNTMEEMNIFEIGNNLTDEEVSILERKCKMAKATDRCNEFHRKIAYADAMMRQSNQIFICKN